MPNMDISGMQFRSGMNPLDASSRVPNAQNQLDFAEVLGKKTGRQLGQVDETKIREAAESFIAVAFVQPIFKQMRSMNQAAAPFGPNKAEQQFQSLMDAQVSRHIVHKSNWPVVERVAQQMLVKAGLAPAPGRLASTDESADVSQLQSNARSNAQSGRPHSTNSR